MHSEILSHEADGLRMRSHFCLVPGFGASRSARHAAFADAHAQTTSLALFDETFGPVA